MTPGKPEDGPMPCPSCCQECGHLKTDETSADGYIFCSVCAVGGPKPDRSAAFERETCWCGDAAVHLPHEWERSGRWFHCAGISTAAEEARRQGLVAPDGVEDSTSAVHASDRAVASERERELERALEQACRDLQQAHNEIVVLNGIPRDYADRHDWPQWTPQANTIRWAERLLGKELGKRGAQP